MGIEEIKEQEKIKNTIDRFVTRFKINESYTFQQHDNTSIPSEKLEIPKEKPELDVKSDENVGIDETKDKVKQIRSLALNLLSDLSPDTHSDECKALETITIACGKLLSPKALQSKSEAS